MSVDFSAVSLAMQSLSHQNPTLKHTELSFPPSVSDFMAPRADDAGELLRGKAKGSG